MATMKCSGSIAVFFLSVVAAFVFEAGGALAATEKADRAGDYLRGLWWYGPPVECVFDPEAHLKLHQCITPGTGICRDDWAFGIDDRDGKVKLWRDGKAIYESWPGAEKFCIGEKSGNYGYGHPDDKSYWWMNDVEIPFLYVEYERSHAKAYLHCPGVGRDDIDALLKIVNLEEEEYGLYKEPLVKFRKGPGVENALWWIDAWGTEWKDDGCEWYFDTKAPTVVPTANLTKKPTKKPTTKKPTTAAPTAAPSPVPSADPTLSSAPSAAPSVSAAPSSGPSSTPSAVPSVSAAPSAGPSSTPSAMPSISAAPSAGPSVAPTSWPSGSPSSPPSTSSAPSCKSCKSSKKVR